MFEYTYARSMKARMEFADDTVHWTILDGPNKGEEGTNASLAHEIAEGVYFIQSRKSWW